MITPKLSFTYRRRVYRNVNISSDVRLFQQSHFSRTPQEHPGKSDDQVAGGCASVCLPYVCVCVYAYSYSCTCTCFCVRWSKSLIGGWKARGKDIKRGDRDSTTTMTTIVRRGVRTDRPRSRRTNYRSSPVQSLAAHAGSGVSYSHPGPQ